MKWLSSMMLPMIVLGLVSLIVGCAAPAVPAGDAAAGEEAAPEEDSIPYDPPSASLSDVGDIDAKTPTEQELVDSSIPLSIVFDFSYSKSIDPNSLVSSGDLDVDPNEGEENENTIDDDAEEYNPVPTVILIERDLIPNEPASLDTWLALSIPGSVSSSDKELSFQPSYPLQPHSAYRLFVQSVRDSDEGSFSDFYVDFETVVMGPEHPGLFPPGQMDTVPPGSHDISLDTMYECFTYKFTSEWRWLEEFLLESENPELVFLITYEKDENGEIQPRLVETEVIFTGERDLIICPVEDLDEIGKGKKTYYKLVISNHLFCPDCEEKFLQITEFTTESQLDPQEGFLIDRIEIDPPLSPGRITSRTPVVTAYFVDTSGKVDCETADIQLYSGAFGHEVSGSINKGVVTCDPHENFIRILTTQSMLHGNSIYTINIDAHNQEGEELNWGNDAFTTEKPGIKISIWKMGFGDNDHDPAKGKGELYLVATATDGNGFRRFKTPDYSIGENEEEELSIPSDVVLQLQLEAEGEGLLFDKPVGEFLSLYVAGFEKDCGDCYEEIYDKLVDFGTELFNYLTAKQFEEAAEKLKTVLKYPTKWWRDDDDRVGTYAVTWDYTHHWGAGVPASELEEIQRGDLRLWIQVTEFPPVRHEMR